MKVAYFAHSSTLNGASRSLIDMIVSLREKGVVPIVFLPQAGPIEQELKKYDIKYYIVPSKIWFHFINVEQTIKMRIRAVIKERYNFLLALKTSRILKKEKVQLVHSNSLLTGFGGQVAAVSGLPHLWHMREFMEEDQSVTFNSQRKAYKRLEKAKELVAISDVVANKFSKKLEKNVVTIYDGVDFKKYSIQDKRILTGPRTEIIITGKILKSKGQMDAVKAVGLLHHKKYNIHLKMIGDVFDRKLFGEIQTYVKEHGLEDVVEYIPFQTDLSEYSSSSDIQLVCSYSEAFGRVTIEGMLSHSLVIGADAGCTPYLIKDGKTGLLYTCGDPQSLAEKIEWAMTHKEQAQELASTGYDHGELFSIERTAEKVCQLYSEILNRGKYKGAEKI